MMFIAQVLRDGPVEASTVLEAGGDRGFSEWMMNQSKRKLGVESFREGASWMWKMPGKRGGGEREGTRVS
jgi:hypothetical protein